jgi:hypothetical protein
MCISKDGLAHERNLTFPYDPELDPSLDLIFAMAAFRYGHTELNSVIPRFDFIFYLFFLFSFFFFLFSFFFFLFSFFFFLFSFFFFLFSFFFFSPFFSYLFFYSADRFFDSSEYPDLLLRGFSISQLRIHF